MPLAAGTRLGPYEITSLLGVGGMGEVYRARDTRLDREVAIKVLSSDLAGRDDLKQRFEREARAISSLHHPHICSLHDIGQQNGIAYLVMEFLTGESLHKRLARGPLTIDEALEIAIQIADALDEAHRKSLIHRDLKPANVMVTGTGAKLLDFGLAKAMEPKGASELTAASTRTQNLTAEGVIIGTVAYMAPEQLEGKQADPRTDIFALGVVLYEMLTGKQAFTGESHASLITSIMSTEPAPVSSVQRLTTPALERTVTRCLAKSPDKRWQTVRDLKSELQWIHEGGSHAASPPAVVATHRSRAGWISAGAAALLLIPLAAIAFMHFREQPPVPNAIRFDFSASPKTILRPMDIPTPSPDGQKIVISVGSADRRSRLWLRSLNSSAMQVVAGTDGGIFPFWSPDSKHIGFLAAGQLKRVDASGGPAQTICDVGNDFSGATWNSDGVILFARSGQLVRVPVDGGDPKPAAERDKGEKGQDWPQFLPDGKHFIYSSDNERRDDNGVYVRSLGGGARKKILAADGKAIYAGRYLLFNRGDLLYAQPFDSERIEPTGDAVPIAEHLLRFGTVGWVNAFASLNGLLAYRTGAAAGNLAMTWFDRSGKRLSTVGSPGSFTNPALSPDEKWLAVGQMDNQTKTRDLWIYDLSRGTGTRLTFDPAHDLNPAWSPDGKQIAFTSLRKGQRDIYLVDANGTREPELVLQTSGQKSVEQWSRDGRFLLFNLQTSGTGSDLYVMPLSNDRKPIPFLNQPFVEEMGQISPNGRWIAYRSTESGMNEIYVQNFTPGDAAARRKWRVSPDMGLEPQWGGDGKELFYLRGTTLMVVPVKTDGREFEAGLPKPLFDVVLPGIVRNRYVVTRDGQRFLVITQPETETNSDIHVIVNWHAGLKK